MVGTLHCLSAASLGQLKLRMWMEALRVTPDCIWWVAGRAPTRGCPYRWRSRYFWLQLRRIV